MKMSPMTKSDRNAFAGAEGTDTIQPHIGETKLFLNGAERSVVVIADASCVQLITADEHDEAAFHLTLPNITVAIAVASSLSAVLITEQELTAYGFTQIM